MRIAVALCVVALVASPSPAGAHPAVDQGRKLYDDLEYKKAQKVLERALPGLTGDDRQQALQVLALCQATLGDLANAAASFKELLDLNPKFNLDRASTPPKIYDLFEKVRSTMPQAQQPDKVVVKQSEIVLTHVAPAEARPGKGLDLKVNLKDPDKRAAQIVLRYRGAAGGDFSELKTAAGPAATLELPGMLVQKPMVTYYIVALDGEGKELTSAGSADQPLSIPVRDEVRAVGATPVYKRWWFWAIAGVLVVGAGAAVAVAVATSGGQPSGGSTSVTVTFTP